MTDIEKFKNLIDEFGVTFEEVESGGDPNQILIYLKADIHRKVFGYENFYTYFVFMKDTGSFEEIGIFED